MTCTTVMSALVMLWTVPAAGLAFVGGAGLGRISGLAGGAAAAHEWVRAMMVLLALLTLLVGSIWAVRCWPRAERMPAAGRSRMLTVHGSLAATAGALALYAGLAAAGDRIWSLAALAGFGVAMVVPRCVARVWTPLSPITVLAVLVAYEMTVGWLQLLGPSTLGSMVLLAEGLALAWCAVSAARIVLSPASVVPSGATLTVVGRPEADPRPASDAAPLGELAVG